MNQKSIIILLILLVVILGVALGYMIIIKKPVFSITQPIDTSQDNSIVVEKEGIKIHFIDGYEKTTQNGKEYVLFGPLSTANFGPDPSQEIKPYHIYQLEFSSQRSAQQIVQALKQIDPITVTPTIENINNYTVVKWAEGGMCEGRNMELIGKKMNILFSSGGCHKDIDTDFDYLKKVIETIKQVN